jgi:hypothetical protein
MPRRSFLLHRASLPALVLATALASPVSAQHMATIVDISRMQAGLEPEGFISWRTGNGGAAEWRVVDDPTASAKKAIAQTSTDKTDYRFPLAAYQPVSAANVDVSVRFKSVAGKVDEAGGIAVRLTTPDDYYVVRANALEDNVNFYRVVKGRRSQIKGVSAKVAANQWHTLGLRAEGERFTISFDGKALFTAADKTFAAPGKVALWTKADSVTHFDAISITPLD